MNNRNPYQHLNQDSYNPNNYSNHPDYTNQNPYDPTNPYSRPHGQSAVNSLPEGTGLAGFNNTVIGVPVQNPHRPNYPAPYHGDGYYNPDVVIVRPRRRKVRVLLLILIFIIVSVSVFTMIRMMVRD